MNVALRKKRVKSKERKKERKPKKGALPIQYKKINCKIKSVWLI